MACVVCGGAVGEPVFANAWEKSRKVSACCSTACAQTFDPDVHWIPSTRPAPVDTMEEARLIRIHRERLRKGDQPDVVTRELLLAGVAPTAIRKLLTSTELGGESTDVAKLVPIRQPSLFGSLFFRAAKAAAPDDNLGVRLETAKADLDRWTKHFA